MVLMVVEGEHILYHHRYRVSKYLVLKPAPSRPYSVSCVNIPHVEACTYSVPFNIGCLRTSCWGTFYTPFRIVCLIPRVEASTFSILFTIVCLHTSCWSLHLHYPLQNRVSTYLMLRRAPSLSPSQSSVYMPRVEACTFYTPFSIMSTYIVLKGAPSLSHPESCVYIPRVEACTFTIPSRIVCLHTSCWGLRLHYPLQNRVSTYLVLKPAPSLSPSQSCVYISRVESCTFNVSFTIVCLHTSCWGEHILYPLYNRVSTYLMLKHAPSMCPSQ